jgi:hypothetical protein
MLQVGATGIKEQEEKKEKEKMMIRLPEQPFTLHHSPTAYGMH